MCVCQQYIHTFTYTPTQCEEAEGGRQVVGHECVSQHYIHQCVCQQYIHTFTYTPTQGEEADVGRSGAAAVCASCGGVYELYMYMYIYIYIYIDRYI